MLGVRRTTGHRLAWLLLGFGVSALAITDDVYLRRALDGSYTSGGALDIGWILGFALLGAAARCPVGSTEGEHQFTVWPELTPYLVAAVGLETQLALPLSTVDPTRLVLGLAAAVAFFVRQAFIVLEKVRLTRELTEQIVEVSTSEARLRGVISTASDPYIEMTVAGDIVTWNPAAVESFGWTEAEAVGRPLHELIVPARLRPAHVAGLARVVAGEPTRLLGRSIEIDAVAKSGTEMPVELSMWRSDRTGNFHAFVRDISERTKIADAVARNERRWRALLHNAPDILAVIDERGLVTYASPSASQILGPYDPERPNRVLDFVHPDDAAQIALTLARLSDGEQTSEIRFRARHVDGSWVHLEAVGTNLLDDPDVQGIVVNLRDITERLAAEEALRREVSIDDLTGVWTRRSLGEQVRSATSRAVASGRFVALVIVDLDGFSEVNRALGQSAGDEVLRVVARRLSDVAGKGRTVARLSADEFAVVVPELLDEAEAVEVGREIGVALNTALQVRDTSLHLSASIGIALAPHDGTALNVLLQKGGAAMRRSKSTGVVPALYSDETDAADRDRLTLAHDLREAIDRGGLTLMYQPKVGDDSMGVEALCRWVHPDRGFIPPDLFIPVAEQTGLIHPLTLWVLETAVADCAAWRRSGLSLTVAINLSSRSLNDPNLVSDVAAALERHSLPAEALTIEVTESAVADPGVNVVAVLSALRDLGLRLSIDDFGTGYSSMAYLKHLPVDELKIDRSFVTDVLDDERDVAIVRSIVQVAHALSLTVVAEGVETLESESLLRRLGCDVIQGYGIARPMPPADIPAWCADRMAAAVAAAAPRQQVKGGALALVVDDDAPLRRAIVRRLVEQGWMVQEAASGSEGIRLAVELRPSFVVLDHFMPDRTGTETARELRARGFLGPVVLFSGDISGATMTEDLPIDVWPVDKLDRETLLGIAASYGRVHGGRPPWAPEGPRPLALGR